MAPNSAREIRSRVVDSAGIPESKFLGAGAMH